MFFRVLENILLNLLTWTQFFDKFAGITQVFCVRINLLMTISVLDNRTYLDKLHIL